MSLEFGSRKSSEGLNDYSERLGEEHNERAWNSLSKDPHDPEQARRITESKRKAMEGLERITSIPNHDEEIARQKVLNSYRNESSESSEQSSYDKTGVGSFAELMTRRGKEYVQQQEQHIQEEKEDRITEGPSQKELTNPENAPIRIHSMAQLPNLNSLKAENERAWFRVASVPSNMSMSERSGTIPPPDNPEEYLFTDENGNNLFAHLANMGINAPEDSNPRKAFAWQIASLDFNGCVKDSFDALSGREKKVFDFDTGAFFQKNKQGVSAVDILVQSGNTAGLTILYNLGNSMQSNHLLRPQVEQVPRWDSSTESHQTKKEQFVVDTSQEGNKLLGNLESAITSSLDIISSANRAKLEQLIAKYKSQNKSAGF